MSKIKPYLVLSLFFLASNIYAQTLFVPFNDSHISYQGRLPLTNDAAELTWPGTIAKINFKGTAVSGVFKDADTSNYYDVLIDHQLVSHKFHFGTQKKTYTLASNLSDGKHSLELFKITEWDKGKTLFYGFEFASGAKLLPPTKLPKRKIEFYGNSITCGYALEDKTQDSPIGYFENNYDSYAAVTARHFNAQYQCIAKSGIGIMLSWFPLIMPEMYDRLDPTDATSKWDFTKYRPDVVVVNLFQNDSWLVEKPDNEQFKARFGNTKPTEYHIIESYKNFVQTIRNKYPKAQIICMLGNMDITKKGSPWPGYVKKAVAELKDSKIYTLIVPYKETTGHPKKEEQRQMANTLIQFIDQHIKW